MKEFKVKTIKKRFNREEENINVYLDIGKKQKNVNIILKNNLFHQKDQLKGF